MQIIAGFDAEKLDRLIGRMRANFEASTGRSLRYCMCEGLLEESVKQSLTSHGIRLFRSRRFNNIDFRRHPNDSFFFRTGDLCTASMAEESPSSASASASASASDSDSGSGSDSDSASASDSESDKLLVIDGYLAPEMRLTVSWLLFLVLLAPFIGCSVTSESSEDSIVEVASALNLPDPPSIVFTGISNWELLFARDASPFIFLNSLELCLPGLFDGVDERFRFGLHLAYDEQDYLDESDQREALVAGMKRRFEEVSGRPLQYCMCDDNVEPAVKNAMEAHGIRFFEARPWSVTTLARWPNGYFFIRSRNIGSGVVAVEAHDAAEPIQPPSYGNSQSAPYYSDSDDCASID